MPTTTRRDLFKVLAAGAIVAPLSPSALAGDANAACTGTPRWARGIEGQRKADLGNGSYLNPIVAGDHPDPTILKDGDDYYMTFSSFLSYPGIVLWHSTDLVNWTPLGPALRKQLGTIWALDLCKHAGRYFIYIPANPDDKGWSIFVIWADDIRGPWSDPIDLQIAGCIDPGHVLGEDGKRYLFVNGIRKVRLRDDGLATDGQVEPAYAPWRYPDDWIVENFAPEGPKLTWHNGWLYLVTAVGGTAGPVTGHMVIAARSRSVHGPWEHCPRNPLVRTQSEQEPWWSRGHATLVEGPRGDWWMVYHGYENGFRTLGRQTLLEPIEWTADGWFRATGGDLSKPLRTPARGHATGNAAPSGFALSDDFSSDRFGTQWSLHAPRPGEQARVQRANRSLTLACSGSSPADSSPLTCGVPDRGYVAEVTLELTGNAEGGLLLFYNHKAFVGIGVTPDTIKTYEYSEELVWARAPNTHRRIRLRLSNDAHVVTFDYCFDDGRQWIRHPTRMEMSGFHHNVFGGFLSLKLGIYAAQQGAVVLRDFSYRALR
ncbi:family 43 glycosylhydrolase [Xanthomonas euroxanthea]|uniref:Family 43 glycosylhydrolase n=1 Tax=Xanthomonas euroxanthea TaxID=2259622 RepID=A0A8E4EX55_9XANT|nr:family 43 glycosylhydrolase [Xanthomonas euroxanthea]CAD1797262.1 family 43 glycosylhydrolase [Xanthomonas euroxanthea]SYZ54733.1 xylan 1,4-beta-xylosidase [Xanthomonas arboricola pv. juglandis]